MRPTELTDSGADTKIHPDDWTITGEVKCRYLLFVNDFEATHPTFGHVWRNFQSEVHADSEEAFAHLFAHHQPNDWDYWEIR